MRLRAFLATTCLLGMATSCSPSEPAPPEKTTNSSIVGTVEMAPTCPNEPAGPRCRAEPAAGAAVDITAGARSVTTVTTDDRGHFAVEVGPGIYRVTARFAGGIPASTDSTEVRVDEDSVKVTLRLDSGIR